MEYNGYNISTTPDCGENTGGYYCEISPTDDLDTVVDYFCIHPDELAQNPDLDYWIRSYVDGMPEITEFQKNTGMNMTM